MTLDELRKAVADGTVDTVLLGFCDMQGRLQGKRLVADLFLEEVAEHGAEGCNYLLAVDVDMNTVDGLRDVVVGDAATATSRSSPTSTRCGMVPWHEATAMCMADIAWHDDSDVVASPRQILRRQLARLAERGWTALAATELEFIIFRDTYEAAWRKAYRDLDPANYYNVDYSMLGTSRVEPLIGRIRREMAAAGLQGRELQGRVQLRPARDQLRLRARARRRGHAHDLQERGQGDRQPGGHGAHLHGQVRRARGQLVPRPSLPARGRRRHPVRRPAGAVRALRRRPARLPARADALPARRTSTPTSATPRARSRRPRSPGGATTAPARCAWSATGRRCGSRTACRAATSTRTSRSPR